MHCNQMRLDATGQRQSRKEIEGVGVQPGPGPSKSANGYGGKLFRCNLPTHGPVMIPRYAKRCATADLIHALKRVRVVTHNVPEANDPVDAIFVDLAQCRS